MKFNLLLFVGIMIIKHSIFFFNLKKINKTSNTSAGQTGVLFKTQSLSKRHDQNSDILMICQEQFIKFGAYFLTSYNVI